jgi:putative DNA primase/helicase
MAVPLNDIVRSQTALYLSRVDPSNPPSPRDIEADLLSQVNDEIEVQNIAHKKKGQLNFLKTLTNAQVADVLLHLHNICRIAPAGKNTDADYDLVAMYMPEGIDAGIYVTSEDTFRAIARQYNYALDTNAFKEILAALKDAAPRRYRCQDRDLIAVNNGIFDYAAKKLLPFTPEKVFLSKSHVDYDPAASSPILVNPDDNSIWEIEEWMRSLSDDPEIVELLWQVLGAIIRPHVRWNKSAWFFSERGNNGKGTLCELMRNLCGPTSYASIPIADFGKDFLLEPLTRASAIIVDENDVGTFIDRAANLKAVITNDVISINRKFKTPIAYQFYGFMVQCLNEFPRIKDKSESFYRRQLFIPFEKNFTGVERRYIKADYLARPEVLQYVLHRVLHMDYYELSEPEATKNVLSDYKDFNDPVRAFWNEFLDQFVWDLLPFGFLYDLYKSWFATNSPSGSPVGKHTFIADLLNIIEDSDQWYCTDRRLKVRPAQRMAQPETLIAQYDLKAWMNPLYTGTDINKKSTPMLAINYTGLLRYSNNPGIVGIVGDDDDEDLEEDNDVVGGQ